MNKTLDIAALADIVKIGKCAVKHHSVLLNVKKIHTVYLKIKRFLIQCHGTETRFNNDGVFQTTHYLLKAFSEIIG